jgi:hypothetical protein
VSRGTVANDNKVMEALGKFMKVFNKKGMEMPRKSIQKEWVAPEPASCDSNAAKGLCKLGMAMFRKAKNTFFPN